MSLDLFVGRTRELERYRELLAKETPWVLIIRGLGGSGKSVLLTEMENQTPQDTCVAKLDFAQKSLREDYLACLENISQQVERYCDPERTVEFKKSIARGRFEIGKRVARGNIEIDKMEQNVIAGSDAAIRDVELEMGTGELAPPQTVLQMRETAKAKFYTQMKTFCLY